VVHPDGVQLAGAFSLRRGWRGPVQDPESYLQMGAAGLVNPAYVSAGLFLEAQPAAWLNLHLQGDQTRYLGTSSGLLSFASPTDDFGDAAQDRRKGQEETGSGRRLWAQVTPALQVGPIVLRHQAILGWYRFAGRGPWFYELENDLLLKDGDRVYDGQSQVLWAFTCPQVKAYAGGVLQVTRGRDAGLYRRRVGVTVSAEAKDSWGAWGRPRGGVVVGHVLEDRNRKGEAYAQLSVGTSWSR
jgi:hypothetical protein